MPKFLAIAEAMLLEKVMKGAWAVSQKGQAGTMLMAAAGLLSLVAGGFFIVAFHAWAHIQYPDRPDLAALATAGAILAVSVVLAAIAYGVAHRRELRRQSLKTEIQHNVEAAIATLDDELGDHIRENPATAVLLAGLAGFILADKVV
jgi:hypothetical protein